MKLVGFLILTVFWCAESEAGYIGFPFRYRYAYNVAKTVPVYVAAEPVAEQSYSYVKAAPVVAQPTYNYVRAAPVATKTYTYQAAPAPPTYNYVKTVAVPRVSWQPFVVPIPIPNFNWSFGAHLGQQSYAPVAAAPVTATRTNVVAQSMAQPKKTKTVVIEEPAQEVEGPYEDNVYEEPVEPVVAQKSAAATVEVANDVSYQPVYQPAGYQFSVVKKFGK